MCFGEEERGGGHDHVPPEAIHVFLRVSVLPESSTLMPSPIVDPCCRFCRTEFSPVTKVTTTVS